MPNPKSRLQVTVHFSPNLKSNVIYLDYKKAFDTVPHKRLVNKLEHLGFAGGSLNWLKAFLINRTMRVVVNGSF